MSIQLAKTDVASPDFYSDGDGLDPVSVSITLDGTNSPTTVVGVPVTQLWVWAEDDTTNIDNYSDVDVTIIGSDTGIVWELSPNGTDSWASTLALSNKDVSVTYHAERIYARATADNDGTVLTANYITADIQITATENPV